MESSDLGSVKIDAGSRKETSRRNGSSEHQYDNTALDVSMENLKEEFPRLTYRHRNHDKYQTVAAAGAAEMRRDVCRRRLSQGDLPHSFEGQKHHLLGNEFATESFLLGRAEIACSPEKTDADEEEESESYVRMTEVAPSNSSIFGGDDEKWKMSLELFSSKKQGNGLKDMPKRMKSYYKAQNELISTYEEMYFVVEDDKGRTVMMRNKANRMAKATLILNVLLLIAKTFAVALSGSISIISSLVDSVVDLLSGAIIWWTTRAVKKRDPYTYPQGRTKLEPIAIIILSVVMSLAAFQLIRESVMRIVVFTSNSATRPTMGLSPIIIACSTVVLKLIFFLICRRIQSSTIQALAMDHRNDVLSNTAAVLCGFIGSKQMFSYTHVDQLKYMDPCGAILISIYIAGNWWKTGYEQIKMLSGYTAKPEFLSKLTWICLNHNKSVKHIDTVRAFYFGNNFLVEVDIVLPEEMNLKRAHDIGESLQQKLEQLPEVERAFVHLDYEFTHNPVTEHKTV